MYIHIRTRGFPITAALRDHAVRRLRFALSRMGDGILSVSVTLGDINGPRGGTDKTCCVRIDLRGRPALVIEHTADDLYAAIDGAADRAGRVLARELERSRYRARRTLRREAGTGDDLSVHAVT